MATTATQRGKSQTHLLHHDFSSSTLKPWKRERIHRCEMEGGARRSAQSGPAQDSRRPLRGIGGGIDDGGLKELREKLLGHLREAADKMKLEMSPIGPTAPAMERAGDPKPEPGRPSVAAEVERPWNLRTRRTSGRTVVAPTALPAKASERTVRLRSEVSEKREKKQRFSVSLTPEEIEEDVFALTGSRPRRRPKKRPRSVQWQLDVGLITSLLPCFPSLSSSFLFPFNNSRNHLLLQAVFPGLWLSEITPELYKVAG
ncbi:hypothetical protein KSP39_PZI005657 [Platanthera zijinensis]|uniref:Uncharacterized protein n=1 Tax=Platanthera zijinensis TaxID=2320716 RepID=A0AAP0BR83_9ASPA